MLSWGTPCPCRKALSQAEAWEGLELHSSSPSFVVLRVRVLGPAVTQPLLAYMHVKSAICQPSATWTQGTACSHPCHPELCIAICIAPTCCCLFQVPAQKLGPCASKVDEYFRQLAGLPVLMTSS